MGLGVKMKYVQISLGLILLLAIVAAFYFIPVYWALGIWCVGSWALGIYVAVNDSTYAGVVVWTWVFEQQIIGMIIFAPVLAATVLLYYISTLVVGDEV